tara:strand:- start:208 stop:999 length:792 start_codon:yes stop_codon:yes gene_type:complete
MIKKIIKKIIIKILSLFGYSTLITKKEKSNNVIIDKLIWEPFLVKNKRMDLYYEGFNKSNMGIYDDVYKQLRYYSLQQIVSFISKQDNINADFAECGCWKGHSAYIISKILKDNNFKGEFHIFDSFEGGLSEKVDKDKNLRFELSDEEIKKESQIFFSLESQVKECLNEFPFTRIHSGWIPEKFNQVEKRSFSFVHLDVDLYQPTIDSLNFFYPRLVNSGIIVCDDYGYSQFPGAKKAFDEFIELNNYSFFYEQPLGGCFLIK